MVDRTRLESYGLSLIEVVDALRMQNVDAPVGTADRGATEAMVRVSARGTSAAQIAEIPVKRVDERTILVRDVAQVIDGVEEATRWVRQRMTAHRARRQKQAGANTVASDGVREAVERMQGDSRVPPDGARRLHVMRESIETSRTLVIAVS